MVVTVRVAGTSSRSELSEKASWGFWTLGLRSGAGGFSSWKMSPRSLEAFVFDAGDGGSKRSEEEEDHALVLSC